ncbi:MAG: heme lyase CcmF/NrfE family subunit [Actinobacteria bacterium]|nr:heme lyase CcmF/NrfE family subunit [Actinomycetota bacterium]
MLAVSLNAAVGRGAVLLGVLTCIAGIAITIAGVRRHDQRALKSSIRYAYVVFAAGLVAFLMMERALITRDFSLLYVQEHGSRDTPLLYNITTLWSALEGSILLWIVVLSGFIAAVARKFRARVGDELLAWAMVFMFAVGLFFFLLAFGPANPFATGPVGVTDGPGPNPLLQNHILVLFHPPILYIGYVGFTVPFAFAMAALVTGRVGEGWLLETRRWTLYSWGFLTIGIILGSWWSYEVLGWGGVWAWDPVENASFLPWLTGTAYLHSVLVQERRGMLRVWNLSLVVATFSLTILGTFLTRSGVINSVHAFSEGDVGPWLLAFFGIVVLSSVILIGWRGERLRSPGSIDSPFSREGAFLANNVVFSIFAFVVLLGTVFPLVVEVLDDRRLVVGSPFFDHMTKPIGLTLLFLMAVAPVLPWRKASQEVLRDRLFWPAVCGVVALTFAIVTGSSGWAPLSAFALGGFAAGAALRQVTLATRRQGWRGFVGRANGGMIVHLGVIIISVALAASGAYTRSQEFVLERGERVEFAGHSFEFEGLSLESDEVKTSVVAAVRIDDGSVYEPRRSKYIKQGMDIGTPSVRTGARHDIYLTLEGTVRPDDPTARIKVLVKPLILWLWVGGGLMALGTVLSAFPGSRRRPIAPVSEGLSETARV